MDIKQIVKIQKIIREFLFTKHKKKQESRNTETKQLQVTVTILNKSLKKYLVILCFSRFNHQRPWRESSKRVIVYFN